MQWFYAARLQRGQRLLNGLVPSYEYSNGDGHVTYNIEHGDDEMTVAVVLWIAFRAGANS